MELHDVVVHFRNRLGLEMVPETFRVRNDAGIDECLTAGAGRKPTRRDVDHLVIAEAVEVRTKGRA